MSQLEFLTSLDTHLLKIEPICVGDNIRVSRTADLFAIIESPDESLLRIDLYQPNDEAFCFQEILAWSDFVVIGWGERTYFINQKTRHVMAYILGSYFGHFYTTDSQLFAASAEHLFCFSHDGMLLWQSDRLGIDGVIVNELNETSIQGSGEWDPPGGWKPFSLSLATGKALSQ